MHGTFKTNERLSESYIYENFGSSTHDSCHGC